MAYNTTYHAISQPDIKKFNEELKQYTDEGYIPYGSLAVTSTCTADEEYIVFNTYAILLGKTQEVKE